MNNEINQVYIDQLKAVAETATQGQWNYGRTPVASSDEALELFRRSLNATEAPIDEFYEVFLDDGRRTAIVGNGPTSAQNAAFIAAASPEAVLSLIRLVEEAVPEKLKMKLGQFADDAFKAAQRANSLAAQLGIAQIEIAKLRNELDGALADRDRWEEAFNGALIAEVYPPDGTTSPFTVINLGAGKVKVGDSIHDHRLPALWFGKNGTGMGDEEVMNCEAEQGETLAVVTFANVECLDILLEVIQRIRQISFPEAEEAAEIAT